MATITTGHNAPTGFSSGETVTATKLNNHVNSATIANIVDADISAGAAIAASKLASTLDLSTKTVTLPDSNIGTAKIADAAVTAAKLDGAQTGSAPIYGCRAWVNFNGTRNASNTAASTNGANVLIRGNGNVASVQKNATGDYTITFTTAMPDANYCVAGIASANIGAEPCSVMVGMGTTTTYGTKTNAAVRIFTADTNTVAVQDCFDVNVLIFR